MNPIQSPVRWQFLTLLLGLQALVLASSVQATTPANYDKRERDWRNGAIVYQVLVDRFVPSANLEAKRALYPAPKVLRNWTEPAKRGVDLKDAKLNSQELDFWGGDLQSLSTRLDYIAQLGADVLYLNPIHLAYTNHKYDAFDFKEISPEYGNRREFKQLAADVHKRGMKLVLDGVFNHMGRNAPKFQEALRNPKSPWRNWFAIGPQFDGGARVWTGYQNLPELNLENQAVRNHLYAAPDSVVRGYLRDGADGWRLDTAFELGHRILRDLTDAAHQQKPGSLVVGEIANYPGEWLQSMDAVMNFSLRQIVLGVAKSELSAATGARMTERMIRDAGIEPMLKSWMVIDNHDIPRIIDQFPDVALRRMVQTLQFTLPGAPNIYYGAEVGMTGGPDPENRGPMRWDLLRPDNPELVWMKQLVALRKQQRALRVGDFRLVESEKLFAFERHTDRALETVVVLANPANQPVTEKVMVANAYLMDDTPMVDLLNPQSAIITSIGSGFMLVTVPARSALVLAPKERALGGYSRYKRVK
ncbi:MAG TPA: glycoside hydrolase family 13 protein [Usitatibacteraceae bacterium]|nr:glycoside hydrolase family 13 protein [Usitatibacteraceae bacterium]